MTRCNWCEKYLGSHEPVEMEDPEPIAFCDQKCLNEYAEHYTEDNWKDIAYMMGARIRE